MKQYRTFKLVYKWSKYPFNSKAFHQYNEDEKQASNIVTLTFSSSSATDKKTILARCKMELKAKGLYSGTPSLLLEHIGIDGYQFVK